LNDNKVEEDAYQAIAFQFKKHLMEEDNEESKTKLEKYSAHECEDQNGTSLDFLTWWKANSSKYPILSMVAKNILSYSHFNSYLKLAFSIRIVY
jgi:hypothetical protein